MNVFKRGFSRSCALSKEWRLVETRRVAQPPEYQVGDPKPAYVPRRRAEFPVYKYGESNVFKQSNKGLYGGSFIQFGNNISESKQKTRRSWLPNVVKKGLWSETLNRKISIKMTAKVLKTISKEGGIDKYLTKDKPARIKELGPTGWKLRYRILSKIERVKNPPHAGCKTVRLANGEQARVYYEQQTIGNTGLKKDIIVGRRKLLKYLYPLEKLERKALDGTELNHKQFIESSQTATVQEILGKLHGYGFDMATIAL